MRLFGRRRPEPPPDDDEILLARADRAIEELRLAIAELRTARRTG